MTPLTLVVCTRDRRESCLETLDSLSAQRHRDHEVVVVDNGGNDGTAEAARERVDGFPVPLKVLVEPEPGLSAARNRALAEARGEAVVFLDDDVTCAPTLAGAYRDAFEGDDVVAAGGRIVPELPDDADGLLVRHSCVPYGGPCAAYDLGDEAVDVDPAAGRPAPFGGNMAVRRSVLEELGGFRTDLGWGPSGLPGEETELFRRLDERPGRILYLPDAEVRHRMQPEKLTREYFLDWYESQGRAAAVMACARSGPIARVLGLPEQAFQLARYRLKKARSRDVDERFACECKLARARGKLVGLVHA